MRWIGGLYGVCIRRASNWLMACPPSVSNASQGSGLLEETLHCSIPLRPNSSLSVISVRAATSWLISAHIWHFSSMFLRPFLPLWDYGALLCSQIIKVNNEILCFSTQICLVDSLVRYVTPFFLGGEQNRGRFVGWFPSVGSIKKKSCGQFFNEPRIRSADYIKYRMKSRLNKVTEWRNPTYLIKQQPKQQT